MVHFFLVLGGSLLVGIGFKSWLVGIGVLVVALGVRASIIKGLQQVMDALGEVYEHLNSVRRDLKK